MTVSLNRPKYMTRQQVKQLSDEGNLVASHTWDHHMFTGYKTQQDWVTQVDKPKKQQKKLMENLLIILLILMAFGIKKAFLN